MIILSWGGGKQSTAMLLMADHGLFDSKPDAAIFADTLWEPASTYETIGWVQEKCSIPIYLTSKGNLEENLLSGNRCATPPAYILNADGSKGILNRQCTEEYKVIPIQKKVRETAGVKRLSKKRPIELWIGISFEERIRMKVNPNPCFINRYPLVENYITVDGCVRWLKQHNYPIPEKSACIGCPFHDNRTWQKIIKQYPGILDFDDRIRHLPKVKGEVYLHKSCKPLRDIDFDEKQESLGFLNECSGHCGV